MISYLTESTRKGNQPNDLCHFSGVETLKSQEMEPTTFCTDSWLSRKSIFYFKIELKRICKPNDFNIKRFQSQSAVENQQLCSELWLQTASVRHSVLLLKLPKSTECQM